MEEGQIVCSVHGKKGSGETDPDGEDGLLQPGDTILNGTVLLSDWQGLCTTTGRSTFAKGTVYARQRRITGKKTAIFASKG